TVHVLYGVAFFFSSRRRHTRSYGDWSSDMCSSDLEARLVGALGHPNVVEVHDIGTFEGRPFIVEELLDGRTLRHRLTENRMLVRSEERRVGKEWRSGKLVEAWQGV